MHSSVAPGAQSRSAWSEQEDDLLRAAVKKYGDRAWATVANEVPGRSSKSCSDRWRNFLSPDIEHPRKSPFSEWEVAVVVQAQHRYGNNWKAISMLLPGRTNRAVKNLFVGNLKWGARLPEIQNRYLEHRTPLEDLLEISPEYPGGPPKERPGLLLNALQRPHGGAGSPGSLVAASTSSAGSAWASDATEQHLAGGGGLLGSGVHGHGHGLPQYHPGGAFGLRRPREEGASPTGDMHSPGGGLHKRLRGAGDSPTGVFVGLPRTSESGAAGAGGFAGAPLTPGTAHSAMGCGLPTFPQPLMGGLPGLPFAGGHGLPQVLMPSDLPLGALPPLSMGAPQPHALTLAPSQQHLAPHGLGAAQPPQFAADAAAGAGVPLLGHVSNDSAALARIMDSILEEDDELLSDHNLGRALLGSPSSSPLAPRISGGGAAAGAAARGAAALGGWPGAWRGGECEAAGESGTPRQLGAMVPLDAAGAPCGAAVAAALPAAPPHTPAAAGGWWGGAVPVAAGAPGCEGPSPAGDAAFFDPSRRVSTGDISSATAEHCATPGAQQPAAMRALCAQLHRENALLAARMQTLQERLGAPAPAPAAALGDALPPLPPMALPALMPDWHAGLV
ncbi:hypothetical protein Rsub_07824 [Raphidocelis subcapitata]|uniref:Transcription factor n=1 Tax=Raphidocelis subcapitata TaxID=307507 RepID=A0A2V0P6I1_9CHLO|nr:hypothetical protein Rsub_07824 [Raphidocelis subcapitata]|eukprot:GBF95474.1 hypothetical protein Rsub_07824 [Raphidocelis subcapitata]